MSKRFYSREFNNFIDNPNINPLKVNMLFGSIINLDTNEIRSVSSINQIPINTSDENNDNLIHKVLYDDSKQKNESNRLNVIKFLVENNVNPEQPNHENVTPLHIACLKQYSSIINYLLSLDVNTDYADNMGNTPFHYYLNGLIIPYVDNQIYDLVPEERKEEEINTEEKIKEIEETVWKDISDSSGIVAMKKTMNYTFLLNDNIKESINKIFREITSKGKLSQDKETNLKMYKEKIVQLYASISSQLLNPDYWNSFKEIDLISINYDTNSYISNFSSTEEYCRKEINDSIDSIDKNIKNITERIKEETYYEDIKIEKKGKHYIDKTEYIENVYTIENYDPANAETSVETYFKDIGYEYYDENNILDELKDNSDQYHKFLSFLNSKASTLPEYCMDYADNYIDLKNNIFIGGARQINIVNNLDINDLSNTIKNNLTQKLCASFTTGLGFSNPIFNNYNDTSNLFLGDDKKENLFQLFNKDMFSDGISYDFTKLNNFDKSVYNRNKSYANNDYYKQFNCFYNLFLNNTQNQGIKNDRLNIDVPIESLMGFAGYINYIRNPYSNDIKLAMSQAFRPTYLKNINRIDVSNISTIDDDASGASRYLSTWIYLLLTEKTNDEINEDIVNKEHQNLESLLDSIQPRKDNAKIIAKYCHGLVKNIPISPDLNKDMSDICQNKNFESRYEKLVYGISKVYSEMRQKPLENHIVDTIFIIRLIADSLLIGRNNLDITTIIKLYLPKLYLDKILDENNDLEPKYISGALNGKGDIFDREKNIFNAYNNILPSRRMLYLNIKIREYHDLNSGVNKLVGAEYTNYYLNKFRESYILGTSFFCCFEKINGIFEMESLQRNNDNRSYELLNVNDFDVTNGFGDNNRITFPYVGFMYSQGVNDLNNMKNYVFNKELEYDTDIDEYTFDYFVIKNTAITREQYRPSTQTNLENVKELLHNLLEYCTISILGQKDESYTQKKGFFNIENEIDFSRIILSYKRKISSNRLTKLLPLYYPVFAGINSDFNKINSLLDYKEKYDFSPASFMNGVINNINKMNAYFFINYYVNYTTDNIYIPSFFYYRIPKIPNIYSNEFENDKFLVFDDSNNSKLSIESSYTFEGLETDASDASRQYFTSDLRNRGTPSREVNINDILNGNKYVTSNSVKKYMKISKKSYLPPSLKGYFYDFYKISIMELIKNRETSDLAKTDITQLNKLYKTTPMFDNLDFKFKRAKVIEKTTKRYLKWYIKNNTVRLLKKFFEKYGITNVDFKDFEIPHIFEDNNFSVSLNKIPNKYPKFQPDDKKGSGLSIFRINEYIQKKDEFLLYSNDYTLNNLERNYNINYINEKIIENLLDRGANPFLKNEMNHTAIKNVLLNYYYPIFEKLKEKEISYNLTNNMDINDNNDIPHTYILEELFNHSNKLLFNVENNKDILEKFAFAQYNEIELIVKNNEKFGNNILRNLKTSFSVIGYLINQYMFRSMFSTSFGETDIGIITNILNKYSIEPNDISNQIYKINNVVNDVSQSDYSISVSEYINDLDDKINKLIEKRDSYLVKSNSLNSYDNMIKQALIDEIAKLNLEIINNNTLKTKIQGLSVNNNIYSKIEPTTYNLVKFYDNLINKNNDNRGSYMELWKKLLDSKYINNDINLVMIEYSKKLSKMSKDSISVGGLTGSLEDYIEKVSPYFKYLQKMIDNYFKTPKYTEINKPLEFIKQILIHMTQNVLCFGFEVAVKKCMFEYYINKFGSSDVNMIYNMIEASFNSVLRKDNKDMREILYEQVAEDLVMNSVSVFKTRNDEVNHSIDSAKEIYINYINLLSASQLQIEDESKLITNLNVIVNYFDAITTNTINRWQVVIENYMKFTLNQSRILRTVFGLYGK